MIFKTLFVLAGGLLAAGSMAAQTLPAGPAAAPTVVPVVPPAIEPENILHLDLSTGGRVSIQLRPDAAPRHVERMKLLVRRGFYDGLIFHRVIDGFMAQGGDPKGDGTSGSDLPDVPAEFNSLPHVRGVLSAARSTEADSANSQFFIMLAPRFSLDGKYSVYGRVVGGMNYVDAIEKGEPPSSPSRIVKASIGADNVPALAAGPIMIQPQAAPAPQ